ncbi:MAG: hypothetical protein IIA44_13260, partial [Acidobacteria bacterium]|nr:hypothetical protein [Acidobacteriota bacterium]
AVIQEIVLQSDWAEGNAMLILIEGVGERTAESHNGDSALAPVLNIIYIVPRPAVARDAFVEVDGQLHFEAEDFDERVSNDGEHDWTIVPDEDSGGGYAAGSGGAHLEALPDSGTNNNPAGDVFTTGPVVSYRFQINTSGDYQIWASVAQLDGSSDSFYLRVAELFGAGGNVGDWWRFNPRDINFQWQGNGGLGNQSGGVVANAKPMIETLVAGTYTLEIAMREDGSAVDEIIIDGTGGFDGTAAGALAIPFSTRATGGVTLDFDTTGPTSTDQILEYFDLLGPLDAVVGAPGWEINPNAQNPENGSNALHITSDGINGTLEQFSRLAIVKADVFEAENMEVSVDITWDDPSGDANDRAGVYARFVDEDNWYYLLVDAGDAGSPADGVELYRRKGGVDELIATGSSPADVGEGDTATLTLRVEGNALSACPPLRRVATQVVLRRAFRWGNA